MRRRTFFAALPASALLAGKAMAEPTVYPGVDNGDRIIRPASAPPPVAAVEEAPAAEPAIGPDPDPAPPVAEAPEPAPVDRLAPILDRFHVRAELFHTGPLCGLHVFDAVPGRAFLHVLRRGTMEVEHQGDHGLVRTALAEPTLLLFPRPVHHVFRNAPVDGSDFTCATLDFDGGAHNPIVQSLPSLLAVPLADVEGLGPTLDLLFAEADRVRCGSRLLAGRLFEVLLVQLLRWALDNPARSGVHHGTLAGLSHPRLAKALSALHARPGEPWPLERLAAQAGMSRSAFAAAFKHAVGTTPAAYRQHFAHRTA